MNAISLNLPVAHGQNRGASQSNQNRRNNKPKVSNPKPKVPVVGKPVIKDVSTSIPSAPFHGFNAQKFSETASFKPESTVILREKFAHLIRANAFQMTCVEDHSHALGAFLRKHMHRAIHSGMTKRKLVDVGGHAVRTATSKRYIPLKGYSPLYESVHSMLPCIPGLDEFRHATWRATLEMRPELEAHDHWIVQPGQMLPNSCSHAATADDLCECVQVGSNFAGNEVVDVICVDTPYYDHVMSGAEGYLMKNNGSRAYFAFHDYRVAIRAGHTHYMTPDSECEVTVEVVDGHYMVTSDVTGNGTAYKHRVVNTNSKQWARLRGDKTLIYNVEDSISYGPHPYVLVSVTCISTPTVKLSCPYLTDYFLTPPEKPKEVSISTEICHTIFKVTEKLLMAPLEVVRDTIRTQMATSNAKRIIPPDEKTALDLIVHWLTRHRAAKKCHVEYDPERKCYKLSVTTVVLNNKENEQVETFSYLFSPIVFLEASKSFPARAADISALFQTIRAMTSKFDGKYPIDIIRGSVEAAAFITVRADTETIGRFSNKETRTFKDLIKNPFSFRFAERLDLTNFFISCFMALLTGTVLIYLIVRLVNSTGAFASGGSTRQYSQMVQQDPLPLIAFFWLMTYIMYMLRRPAIRITTSESPMGLVSTCVTIKNRLDLSLNKGRIDANWKFRNPDLNILGLTGNQAASKLGCSHEGKILATQIGPQLHGSVRRTPTIKHPCDQCIIAASVRATSNHIAPDPAVVEEWSKFFMKMADKAAKWIIMDGGLDILIDPWAEKYPLAYRENLYRELEKPDLKMSGFNVYDSFPKVEMQFTTVTHEEKDSELNDVKERQISAPPTAKKVHTGAMTYALEGLYDRHDKSYCGRKNWVQICKYLDEKELDFQDPIWCMADASGFDMTQVKILQEWYTKYTGRVLYSRASSLIYWDVRLKKEVSLQAVRDSEKLKVSLKRGQASYEAEGRASGDLWTTFANTLMNCSYWRYAMSTYGFNPHGDGARIGYLPFLLLIKGDDVIFCVEKKHQKLAQMAMDQFFSKKNEAKCYGLGLVVKDVAWGPLEKMNYLSCNFFRRGNGKIRMARDLRRVFQTMCWSTQITPDMPRNVETQAPMLAHSKGDCLAAWGGDLPIVGALASLYRSIGKPPTDEIREKLRDKEFKYVDVYRVWLTDDDVDDRDAYKAWLFDKYDITDSEIAELEDLFPNLGPNDIISHPVIEKIYNPKW